MALGTEVLSEGELQALANEFDSLFKMSYVNAWQTKSPTPLFDSLHGGNAQC